jgi:hypothetical protein
MLRLLHVFLAPALVLAGSLIPGKRSSRLRWHLKCGVDDPGVACFGGGAWRREEDDQLTLWGTIGWKCEGLFVTRGHGLRERTRPFALRGLAVFGPIKSRADIGKASPQFPPARWELS